MVWVVVIFVSVIIALLMTFSVSTVYSPFKWLFVLCVVFIYASFTYNGYRFLVTKEMQEVCTVVSKKEEETERTENWVTICHYLLLDDGLEYWAPIRFYNDTEIGDKVEVKYTYYEGKIIKHKLILQED